MTIPNERDQCGIDVIGNAFVTSGGSAVPPTIAGRPSTAPPEHGLFSR